MTEAELNARIAKFKRRAPMVTSQSHLEKIIGSFPEEHRPLVISEIGSILPERLIAQEPANVELKVKDEANPTIQEATASRLNSQNAKILEQAEVIKDQSLQLEYLTKRLEESAADLAKALEGLVKS